MKSQFRIQKRDRWEPSHNGARKRPKIGAQSGLAIESKKVDQLPWTQVPFPERFEDAEGFLDLEELSDVDVIRDDAAGKVEFKVSLPSLNDSS